MHTEIFAYNFRGFTAFLKSTYWSNSSALVWTLCGTRAPRNRTVSWARNRLRWSGSPRSPQVFSRLAGDPGKLRCKLSPSSSLNAGEGQCRSLKTGRERERILPSSIFAFPPGLTWNEWGPPTLGGVICSTQATGSNVNLTQKLPLRHPRIMFTKYLSAPSPSGVDT